MQGFISRFNDFNAFCVYNQNSFFDFFNLLFSLTSH